MLDALRRRIARAIAPAAVPRTGARMYASAKNSRLTGGWYAPNNSADSELVSSLTQLRARSRSLMRDAPYAKRARVIVVNNVVGSGIGMQARVMNESRDLRTRVNNAIEDAWAEWAVAENCHTGGKLDFADLERQAMGQIFEAGEILIRKHYRPFGRSRVPLALELVEPELLAEEFEAPAGATVGFVRMGVEVDRFHRPIGFWLREQHPGEVRLKQPEPNRVYRVPADQIFHLYPVQRWPQTRGEPWLHAVARRLNDMDGYSEAEIVAARAAASYMGIIETPEPDTAVDANGNPSDFELEPGAVKHLMPGEEFTSFSPNRPNPNMDPFMRMMLREVAAGIGVSYESLSRDYSQSNYSSSRLALLDDRDLWQTLQQWFIRAFRAPLHRDFIQQAVLSRAIEAISVPEYAANPRKFEAVSWKPRGWSWVDPTKEVAAYKEAIKGGLTTRTAVIAATANGRDIEDIDSERQEELEAAAEMGLAFDTDPIAPTAPAAPPADADLPAETDDDDTPARVLPMRAA